MLSKNHKLFIKKAKEEYKKIGHVECPAFDNKKVIFNNYGFNHLIRKGQELRPIEIQIERINLTKKYATQILKSSYNYMTYLKDVDKDNHTAYFWSFISKKDGLNIRVVVRQLENGPKHFFSIHIKRAQTSPK